MIEKQLTIREIIDKLGKSKCISCGKDLEGSDAFEIRLLLCRKCKSEAMEDLENDR